MNVPVNSDVVRWDVGADVVAIVPAVGESDGRKGSLAQVERYCSTILAPPRAVYPPRSTTTRPREDDTATLRDWEQPLEPRTPRWDHEVLKRMFIASLLGLALQWGTISAGVVALVGSYAIFYWLMYSFNIWSSVVHSRHRARLPKRLLRPIRLPRHNRLVSYARFLLPNPLLKLQQSFPF